MIAFSPLQDDHPLESKCRPCGLHLMSHKTDADAQAVRVDESPSLNSGDKSLAIEVSLESAERTDLDLY